MFAVASQQNNINININENHYNNNKMSRKDDPVFNVRFVQLVENHPCLWKSTHPGYSKKEEIQKAWQFVANETKDTVRNCRERWRTIRSSFLRSLKLSRTQTGRGKRKYYLSKYLQFLMPYTKTRLKSGSNLMVLRRLTSSSLGASETAAALAAAAVAASGTTSTTTTNTTAATSTAAAAAAVAAMNGLAATLSTLSQPQTSTLAITPQTQSQPPPPMTCISNMPMSYDDHTKDSNTSELNIAEHDVLVSLHEDTCIGVGGVGNIGSMGSIGLPPRLRTIKLEHVNDNGGNGSGYLLETQSQLQQSMSLAKVASAQFQPPQVPATLPQLALPITAAAVNQLAAASTVDWTELVEWIKSKNNEYHRRCLISSANNSPSPAPAPNNHIHHNHHSSSSNNNHNNNSSTNNNHNNNYNNNMNSPVPSHMLPDADQMFLNSLHPFLKEMSGKQNRRFRQKVIALIDDILDNMDV